jgi:hypothetical protein
MNQTTFQKSLKLLSEATSKRLSPELAAYWWRRFGDLPDEILIEAFQRALDSADYFPSPAQFMGILRDISASQGAIVGGAGAWEAIERDILGQWSETNDRLMASAGKRYAWPDERSRDILRNEMGCMVSALAQMHPRALAEVRDRFVAKYDAAIATDQARAGVAKLDGGNVRQLREGAD